MVDIPNPGTGVLVKHRHKKKYRVLHTKSEIPVYTKGNNPLWYIVDYEEEISSKPNINDPKESVTEETAKTPEVEPEVVKPSPKPKRVTVSSLLKKHRLSKDDIEGTGRGGKVTLSDVRNHIKNTE